MPQIELSLPIKIIIFFIYYNIFSEKTISNDEMKEIEKLAKGTTPNNICFFINKEKDNIARLREGKINSYRYDICTKRKKHYTIEVSEI